MVFHTYWNFQHTSSIVFNMHYRFQHTLKFSTCFFNTAKFSIACTLCRSCIQTGPIFNIVFNMYYRFKHTLKFSTCFFNIARFSVACTLCRSCIQTGPIFFSFQHSFQHALQISTHPEIFNMLFQYSKVFHSMHIMQELHTNRPNFQHSFQHVLQI